MAFFTQFPKTKYSVESDGIQTNITDIYRYVDVIEKSSQNVLAYKIVDVFDGERPDNLSQRLYGTPDYYWTFFIANDNLKDGIEAWPKADVEVAAYTDLIHKDTAAFRFPHEVEGNGITVNTLAGLPLQNENFAPFLYLFSLQDLTSIDGTLVKIYNRARIIDYKPNLSQIWIDTSTIDWYSDYEPYKELIGGGGALDVEFKKRAQSKIFYTGPSNDNYTVRFINPYTQADGAIYATTQKLQQRFIEDVRTVGKKFKPTQGYDVKTNDQVEESYRIKSTQFWRLGKLAPAHYYNPTSIEEEQTEYSAGPEATNYVSREQEIYDDNDALRRIKYVSPQYIQAFALEYKKLLNE